MAKDYNEVLNDLTAKATAVAQVGSEEEKEKFNLSLKSMASASNTDPNLRQAALQLRLPDVLVSRNEEGNLSFGRGTAINNTLPKDFAATATVLKPDETLIVGGQDAIGVFNPTQPRRSTSAAVTNGQLAGIGDSATSPALRSISAQLNAAKQIADPVERQRALLSLNTSVSNAINARHIELINQQERAYGVPELEARLAQEEAADRADENWQQFQTDSPITGEVRNKLRVAKADAYTFGERAVATDPVLTNLKAEIDSMNSLIKLEGEDPTNKVRKIAAISYNDFTPEQKTKARLVADALYNKSGSTDADAIRAMNNNNFEEFNTLLDDQGLLLFKAFDPTSAGKASQYKDLAQRSMPGLDVNIAGAYIDGIRKAIPIAGNIEAMEGKSPELKALATNPDVIALVQKYNQGGLSAASALQGTKSVEEKKIEQLNWQRDIATLAVKLTQQDKLNALNNQPVDLPDPSGAPNLKPIIDEARANGTGISGLINSQAFREAIIADNPQANQALINSMADYIMGVYQSNGPASVMGIDPYIERKRLVLSQLQNVIIFGQQGRSPLDIMSDNFIWNWPGNMVAESLNAISRNTPDTSAYAKSIAETPITSKALQLAQKRQEGNK